MAKQAPSTRPPPRFNPSGLWLQYAIMAGIGLLVACGVGKYMIIHLLELQQGEAFEQTYYLLLLVVAVAVAFAIFSAMQAISTVSGKYLGLHFRVGCPAAGALLVVVCGYYWHSP